MIDNFFILLKKISKKDKSEKSTNLKIIFGIKKDKLFNFK